MPSKRFLYFLSAAAIVLLALTSYKFSSAHAEPVKFAQPSTLEKPLCYLNKLAYSEGAIVHDKGVDLQCKVVKVDWVTLKGE